MESREGGYLPVCKPSARSGQVSLPGGAAEKPEPAACNLGRGPLRVVQPIASEAETRLPRVDRCPGRCPLRR